MHGTARRPNIIVFLADDLGYSDVGCYGGEIETPVIDGLAAEGVRFSRFYNAARCSPSRASLLTGRHPHETGIGVLTGDRRPHGYPGDLSASVPTIGELLRDHSYATGMTGKWHLSEDLWEPSPSWPTRRGFDYFYGTISGTSSYYAPTTLRRGEVDAESETASTGYYYTRAIGAEGREFVEQARLGGPPFFLYVAFTAPHWPLHAPAETVARYRGRYDCGWDQLRQERLERQIADGLLPAQSRLTHRDDVVPTWEEEPEQEWQARRMEVYAAQVSEMDRAIGEVLEPLRESGELADTLVLFLSDNGASAEDLPIGDPAEFVERRALFNKTTRDGEPVALGNEPGVVPGPENSYSSYGRAWANLSNTPFRRYKKWVHEGGIATPFICSWPNGGVVRGAVSHEAAQLTSVVPTLLEAAGVRPAGLETRGQSLLPALRGEPLAARTPLFWEHCGNAAVRAGRWKLARLHGYPWELYDIESDPIEMEDVSATHPEVVGELAALWRSWADEVGVIPFDDVVRGVVAQGLPADIAER